MAQLKSAVDQLDELAVRATRAATDATEANAIYARVGTGSDHPTLRAAMAHSRTGTDKAHRLARLSSEAARSVSAYLDAIAPGSVPQAAAASGPPSGGDLAADSDRRDLARSRTGGFLNRFARNADDAQDLASESTQTLQQWAKALRDTNGSSGTQSAGTGTPPTPAASPRQKIDGAEAAGNLVVFGLLAGVATHRAARLIRKWRARGQQR
ncbi:hypothetical protein D0Q02_22760 [Micromonospora craniellae]|uniref:Uncharacterized protein n=1 Tax=Micromonospora craniellae TaxID=2294034 RepID=A0A372FUD5_9ACTN|nr:hypothetical protein D0Q02_22760 [Micromonospora craniellae]